MSDQVLTIVLKGDGTGLTGTVRIAEADARRLGSAFDGVGKKGQGMGAASKRAAGDVDALTAAERRADASSRSLASRFNTLRATIAALGIGVAVRDLVSAGTAMDRYQMQLTAATGSQAQAGREMAFLRQEAQRLGVYLPSMVEGYAGLSAATRGTVLEGQRTRDIFIGVAEAARVMNLDTASAQGVFVALQQIAGKGVVSMEELRQQLGDRMPGAMQMAASAMDMTVAQFVKAVSEGKVLSNDLLPKLARKMHEFAASSLDAATKLPIAQFQRFKTAIFEASASLANGGFLQTLGKSAGEAAAALKKLTDTGAIQKFGAALATAAQVLAVFYSAQLLQSGRAWIAQLELQNGLVGGLIVKQAQWGAATAASFKTAFTNIGLLGIAINTAAAAMIGWQIGAYFRDNFVEARLFGIAFINGMLKGWEYLKQGALIAWEAIKAGFQGAINIMRNLLAAFVDSYARLASIIPSFMGGDKVAGALSGLADRMRSTTDASEGLATAVAKINTAADANRAKVDAITDGMADYEIAQATATRTTQDMTAATNASATAAANAVQLTDRQRDAQASFATENARMAAALGGPAAQAWFEYSSGVAEANAALAKHEATQDAVIERERLLRATYQQTMREIERSQDILGQIRSDYADQIRLSGLTGQAYRVEAELQRRLNDARQQHVKITPDLVASYREEITWGERQVSIGENAARAAQDYQDSWLNAVQSVGRALGDWVTGTISSLGDLRDALVDVGKRWFSDRFSQGLTRLFNGGYADAGTTGGGGGGWLAQLVGSSQTLQKVAGWFGFGGGASPAAAGMGWANAYGAGAQLAAGAGVMLPQYGGGALVGAGAAAAQGGGYGSSLLSAAASFKPGTMGKFLQSPAAPWLSAAAGAYYGWQKGGDTPGKVLGAAAYGTAAYGVTAGVGAGLAASAAGAGAGAAASAGLAAIPVVGWIALAAIAVNAISGGKLFGTKFKLESAQTNYSYGDGGIGGSTDITKVKQRSLFRGRKWSTSTQALSSDARAAMDEAFGAIDSAVTQAAGQLGVSVPALLGATFTQQFDSKGKLKSEFGEIAGRVYREAQDAFNQRYLAENLLNVAGVAGGHAATIQQLANGFRGSPQALTDFATLMLAITSDAKAGKLLWDDTDAALQNAVASLKLFQRAGESIAETYQRVSQGVGAYADMVAGVRSELLTHDLSEYAQAQVQIEMQYRAQVKQANDLAKALGLSGARSEDLAAIEQLRAQRMADLQQQMEKERDNFLGQLRISDLAPGTDQSKFTDAMQQLRDAVGRGDLQAAEQLSQQTLGYGRNLYASGSDYNALYNTVTGLLNQLDPADAGLTPNLLQDVVDQLSTLPQDIAAAMFNLVASPASLPPPPGATSSGSSAGASSSASSGNPKSNPSPVVQPGGDVVTDALLGMAADTKEILRLTKRDAVVQAS